MERAIQSKWRSSGGPAYADQKNLPAIECSSGRFALGCIRLGRAHRVRSGQPIRNWDVESETRCHGASTEDEVLQHRDQPDGVRREPVLRLRALQQQLFWCDERLVYAGTR